MLSLPILSTLIMMPLMAAGIIVILQTLWQPKVDYIKYVGVLSAFLPIIASLYLLFSFNPEISVYQFEESHQLMNFEIRLGIDGLSVLLIVLTTFITFICIASSLNNIKVKVTEFIICFLILESCLIIIFSSLNILLFYVFFELTLVPMYLIIGIWGGENRVYSSIKFFIYTLCGSLFFLLSIIYLYLQIGSLEIEHLERIGPSLTLPIQRMLWCGMFLSFAVKIPIIPFHTWLPHAHVQAPTAGSLMLAGILLKLGAYGFLKFALPILPDASLYFSKPMLLISSFAVLYGSIISLAQEDMKKMIAYSSIAHMGYISAGIFSLNTQGFDAAIFQMISHGIVSPALFLSIGILYDRTHSKKIDDFGGIAERMPVFASLFLLFVLASVGLPGTSGFIGEFLAVIAVMQINHLYAIILSSGIILGAIYMFILYKRVVLGEIKNDNLKMLKDLNIREISLFLPMAFLVLYLGITPSRFMEIYSGFTNKLTSIFI